MAGSKRALIFGVGGQDGSYLADLLLSKPEYAAVHGVYRRCSGDNNLWRVAHLRDDPRLILHQGDLCDAGSLCRVLDYQYWDEIYNLADQDHVGWSRALPAYALQVTAGAVGVMLEALKGISLPRPVRFFQPCTALMFGVRTPPPQTEDAPLAPASPYACAKAAAYLLCQHYRREHGLHVTTAILYNHDSVRRRGDYLLHTLCKGAARCAAGRQKRVVLDDVDAWVDIGHAPEYVEGMWRLTQLDEPADAILASGCAVTVRELCRAAFGRLGMEWEEWVDSRAAPGLRGYSLSGSAERARRLINWKPTVNSEELAVMLVDHYAKEVGREGGGS